MNLFKISLGQKLIMIKPQELHILDFDGSDSGQDLF